MHLFFPLALAITLVCAVSNQSCIAAVPLGIWSWNQDCLMTKSARSELLGFCKKEGISHIDQHVSMERKDGHLHLVNANKIALLVQEAAAMDITVSALRGDQKMFIAKSHDARLQEITALVEWNRQLPNGLSLLGIKYDVEPYLTDQWKAGGQSRRQMMREYLQCLEKLQQYLQRHEPELLLSVDVPFWWDKSELELDFDGKSKPFVNHIQDRVSSVALMSYRRSAKDVLRLSEQELGYSRSKNKNLSVALGLNFRPASGTEEVTTFAGYPPADFRTALSSLRKTLSDSKHVRCIMLHDYESLVKYLERETD